MTIPNLYPVERSPRQLERISEQLQRLRLFKSRERVEALLQEAILALTKALPNLPKDQARKLLEYLAGSVRIDPRKRLLIVTWRLGGENWYRVPQFRGGPRRSVEQFHSIVRKQLSEHRLQS